MFSKRKIINLLLIIAFIGIAVYASTVKKQDDSLKVTKKASDRQITAAAKYDGGHFFYFGDASGHVFSATKPQSK
jgi:hypothetical protein